MRDRLLHWCLLFMGCICLACSPVTRAPWELDTQVATAEPAQIMLLAFGQEAAQNPIIEGFTDQRSDITVVPYPAQRWGWGNTLVDRLREDARAGADDMAIPDVVQTRVDFLAALGEEGYLLDLSPFMRETGELSPEAFYPELIEPLQLGDQVFVLPLSVDPVMLFYNVDLFAEKGVAPPTADWTWDDMLEAAIRIAEPDNIPPVYGLLVVDALPLIYQNGGSLVDDPVAPANFTLDSPATVEAIRWIVDLDTYHNVSPPLDRLARHEAEAFTTVHEGRVGMWISPMSFRNYVGEGTTWSFRWGAAPLPRGRYRATVGTVEGIAILKNTNSARACWEFARYWVTHLPPGAGPLPYLPALRSLAESQDFLSRMPDKGVDAYALSLPALMPPPSLPGGVSYQLSEILLRSLQPMFTGEMSVEEAMQTAQKEAEETLLPQLAR